jgi:hypothetical protein
MKNRFESWCYICGELVEEQQGLAEQVERNAGDSGWGKTKWVVRHMTCKPLAQEDSQSNKQN